MFGTYCRMNVHCMDSDRTVIRALRKMWLPEVLFTQEHKEARKRQYRRMLAVHHEQRELFIKVNKGDFT